MKPTLEFLCVCGCVAFLGVACKRDHPAATATEATVVIGPKYSAKNGLFIPEDTRRAVGLKVVEVVEQKVPATLQWSVSVYSHRGSNALASGFVSREQAKLLPPGCQLQLLTDEGLRLSGVVSRLNEVVQQPADTTEVLIEVANPAESLPVGRFLQASLTVQREGTAVVIPREALLECVDGFSVFTASGDSFVRTAVKVGALHGEVAEILDGLYAGDQVVTQAAMTLWMAQLAAVKGGQSCCAVTPKTK